MIIENPELLRLWLTIHVRKLCDADPSALSKYVLALIRKDKPDSELRQSMIDQLDVFLQNQTIPFVDRLFLCIGRREYLEVEEPAEGTVYMLNQGKKLIPYHDLPNPFDSSTSSISSHDTGGETVDLNTSASSESSLQRSMELGAEAADLLNSSGDSIKFDDEILTSDPNFKSIAKGGRGSNAGSGSSVRKGEKDRLPRRKSRSPRRTNRSRSRDRARRSWSPKEYLRTGRTRGVAKRSPGRRNERDPYNRRRSPRNRSSSPYGRTRSPHRYSSQRSNASSGGAYEPKRIRSPIKRERSRSRSPLRGSRIDGMDTKCSAGLVPASSVDQTGRNDSTGAPKLEEYSSNGNRCKDFDERGLCMRGELCPYDHGQNPVVLQDVGVSGIKRSVPIDSEGDHSGLSIPYRTNPPDFHLPRPTRPAMMNPEVEMHNPGPMVWGPLPPFHPGGPGPRMRGGLMLRPPMYPIPPRELINVPVLGPPGTQMMQEDLGFHPPMHHMGLMFAQQQRHGLRGRGRGRGGMFDHSRLGAKAKVYNNCSLEVKRIPSSQNTISDLNSHFVQFGKIVNIQINFEDDPEAALITFSSPSEAYAAYKSTEAVLNNRFIRVFWHNKEKENEEGDEIPFLPRLSAKDRLGTADYEEEMDGGDAERVLVSGVNLTKTFYNPNPQKREFSQEKVQAVEAIKKSQEQLAAQEQQKRANEEKKRETIKLMHDLQKKKQLMLIEQIEQQKKLIHKLENSKSMKPEEREELMKLIKSLQDSIETIKKGVDIGGAQHQQPRVKPQPHPPQQPLPTAPTGLNPKEPVRDILDAELDLYNTELEGGDTVALQQKVAELRSQAYSTGVPFGRGRGGFRGAPPTRGSFKPTMRGGSVSRTVDRRTTTLFITHFPSAILPELMAHFAQYGLVPYHKPDYAEPSLTMTYENRKCAETAFVKGRVYKEHTLDIKWVPNSPRKGEFKNGSPAAVADVEELEIREEIEV